MPRIKIEDKHTYSSVNMALGGRMSRNDINIFDPDMIQANFPTFPAPGTDENNRIGRKVTTSSISWETFLCLNNSISQNVNNVKTIGQWYRVWADTIDAGILNDENLFFPSEFGNMTKIEPITVSIREFVVEFDLEFFQDYVDGDVVDSADVNFRQLLANWFYNLVIQNGTTPNASNRTLIKRESTGYTGQFTILYDKIHYMSFSKPQLHIKETIPYKRTLNFNSGNAAILPSNKLVCHFFVGPSSVYVDYGNLTFGDYLGLSVLGNNASRLIVCQIYETLKLKYVDI